MFSKNKLINPYQPIPARELATLLKVSSALATSLELPVVLQIAIDSAVKVMQLETGAIYLLEGDQLVLGATTPPLVPDEEWLLHKPEVLSDHPHLAHALAHGLPVFVSDALSAEFSPAETALRDVRHLRSILYIPLLLEEKATGALILGSTSRVRRFNRHEIALSRTLSYQITLAVANARLYRSVQESNAELTNAYDATLLGWSLALEMRDQDTRGHTQRVTRLTEDLACRMDFPVKDLPHLRRGALLTTSGKSAFPT